MTVKYNSLKNLSIILKNEFIFKHLLKNIQVNERYFSNYIFEK